MTTSTKSLLRENEQINFSKIIESHKKRFAWVSFKYEGPEWDLNYLIGVIKEELDKKPQLTNKSSHLKAIRNELMQKQKIYTKKLNMDREYKHLFKVARELMVEKEHQKDYLFKSYFYLDKLVKEGSARLYLSPKQFRHLTHQEILNALVNKKVDHNILNSRIKYCVMVLREKSSIKLLTKEMAKAFATKEFPPLPKLNIFKGYCACPGKIKGVACIIQETKDMAKMKDGAVLVTTRTNPNLLPAIRKSSAIVADIGGVGSHAAIVSRELNIPCVVGVINASMILKDGDIIEVDATKGIVTKL